MDGAVRGIGLAENHYVSTSELLSPRIIEGMPAEGQRITTTLEAGAVGNDREIVVTDERWASKKYRILVLWKLSDPRFGDTTRRLVNVAVTDPDPALFMPPPDYATEDMSSTQ
jgi:hypothetical protein